MTPYQLHVRKWKDCEDCDLSCRRNYVVLSRGDIPAEVAFVGEAPGPSENAIGQPFVGPAGQLLDKWVNNAVIALGRPHRIMSPQDCGCYRHRCPVCEQGLDVCKVCKKGESELVGTACTVNTVFTNLVGCIPLEEDGAKFSEPPDYAVRSCSIRLREILKIADRNNSLKLVVAVGTCAAGWLSRGYRYSIILHRDIPIVEITHPAAVLRANAAQKSMMGRRVELTLQQAFKDYLHA